MTLRARGALAGLAAADRAAILARGVARDDDAVRTQVAAILEYVRDRGDEAVRALTRELDHVKLEAIEVPRAAMERACDTLDPAVRTALERAERNLRRASEAARPRDVMLETEPGITVGRRADPLARVGIYAPGGRAAYPSSVLMGVVPAVAAGVEEIIICSPPGPDGRPASTVLAAAAIAGAHRVFAVGGAQAIAAMAFGTDTVPRVDRIVGPGNAFVNEAKLQVASLVGIDSPAGPSELCVLADATTSPALVAREMVAQAEHDPDASVVAVVVGDARAVDAIESALAGTVAGAARRSIVRAALAARGALLSADSLDAAIAFANAYAAEHLLLAVADPAALVPRLRGHGAIFVGAPSAVAFGDYLTGANHVLPTGGLARIFSGLSTEAFMRWTSWQAVSPEAAARLAGDTGLLADTEGLPAHAA
ncbi:MAG: histidinol dehydrogenase, partial [Gemmatimonadetes bacterium]|nr:histidinol dehydrogenase [Gemmatimonadota bacterium]